MSEMTMHDTPYKGLVPYSEDDAPFFFGREPEREIITANLMAARLTLLYGASGVGKSSVLRAGVAFHLRQLAQKNLYERGISEFGVTVFNSWRDDPVALLEDRINESLSYLLPESSQRVAVPPDSKRRLTDVIETWSQQINGDLFIILDQFEEYFLYHAQEESDDSFAAQLSQAVNRPDLRVSFLISIREDALAKLDRFKGRIPNLFDNYLRIDHLDREAGRDAITEPIKKYNSLHQGRSIGIEPALIEAILDQVKTGEVVLSTGGRGTVQAKTSQLPAHERIETSYLQLVMTRLWREEVNAKSHALRLETLDKLGGAKRIVQTHVDAVMKALGPDEQNTAAQLFYYLVTRDGAKIAHTVSALSEYTKLEEVQISSVLEKLCGREARILQPVDPPPEQPNAPRYEIRHDKLAAAILDWRRRHAQTQERAEAARQLAVEAEERTRAEEQLKRERSLARRLRWALVGLVVLLIGMGGLTVYAFRKQRAATVAEADAVEQRLAVEKAQTEIVNQKNLAETQRDKAEKAKDEAEAAKIEVGKQKGVAVSQRDAAEKAAVEANKQRNEAQRARAEAEESNTKALAAADAADTAAFEAGRQKGLADDQRRRAEQETRQARLASANLLSLQAKDLNETNPQRSLLLAVEAMKSMKEAGLQVPAVEETLRTVLAQTGGQVVSEHKATVDDVALSPGNRLLVTVDRANKTAQVWDLAAERADASATPRVLKDVGGPIAISPDGHWLITGSYIDGREVATASLWDLRLPNLTAKPLHTDTVATGASTVIVSPDSHWLVTSDGQVARLWNLASSNPSAQSNLLTDNANRIVISPDSHWLAISEYGSGYIMNSGNAGLWDLTAPVPSSKSITLGGHTAPVTQVVFSADSKFVATGSYGRFGHNLATDDTMRIWTLKDLNLKVTPVPTRILKSKGPISGAVFSSDSHTIVTGGDLGGGRNGYRMADSTALVWNLNDQSAAPRVLEAGAPAAISTDNEWLVTYSLDQDTFDDNRKANPFRALVWNLKQNDSKPMVLSDGGRPLLIRKLFTSDDRRWLLTISEDNSVRAWDLTKFNANATPLILRGHDEPVVSFAFGDDGQTIVTGSADKTARLWDLTSSSPFLGTNPHIIRTDGGKYFLSPNQRLLLTVDPNHTASVWDLTAKAPTAKSIVLRGHSAPISAVAFSGDNRWVLTGGEDTTARLWDLTAADPSASAQILRSHTDKISSVAISKDNHWLVTGSFDGTVRVWDFTNSTVSSKWVLAAEDSKDVNPDNNNAIGELYLSADNHWLITRRFSWAVGRLWDLRAANQAPKSQPLSFFEFRVSPDGHWMATSNAGGQNSMSLFNLKEDNPVATSRILAGDYRISYFDFSPDSHWLCTDGPKHMPRLWDLTIANPGTVFTDFPGSYNQSVSSVGFTPDSRVLVTRNYDGTAHIWNLQNPTAESVVIHGDTNDPGNVKISADGRWLVIYPTARLWDLTAREIPENSIKLPVESLPYSVDFSSEGKDPRWLIIENSANKTVRLWNMRFDELVELACRTAGRNLTPEEWKKYFPGQQQRDSCPALPAKQ